MQQPTTDHGNNRSMATDQDLYEDDGWDDWDEGNDDEESDPWLCMCGHYEESGLHCSECGNEPPWGCDCSSCSDVRYDDDDYFDNYEY